MTVINVDEYRAPSQNGPFTISFIGFHFATPIMIRIGDGRYHHESIKIGRIGSNGS